jgi:hypothetical protein
MSTDPSRLDSRLQYLIDAGVTLAHLAELIPVATKRSHRGWVSWGPPGLEIARHFWLKTEVYDNRERCIWGKEKFTKNGCKAYIKSPFGNLSIQEIGLKMVDFGYALVIW